MSKRKKMIFLAMVLAIGLFLSATTTLGAPARKLVVAVGQEPSSMDHSLTRMGADNMVVENWGEFLIQRMPSGELKPGLATSWKMSPDGKEMEFILRKGVKFHSGDPMTAKDVEFSFERGREKSPTHRARLRSVEKFEVIDDYRFKIIFKTPDVLFIPERAGAPIVSKRYYDRVGEDKFAKEPVGTGPYKLVRHVPGEYADLERFEDFWGEKPPVKEARIYFVSEDMTRVTKLKAGEVDLICNCPYPLFKDIEKSQGFKVVKLAVNHPTPSVIFSTRNPNTPWHDKRVRLAMAYAIDWKTIVKSILYDIPNHYAFLAPHELGYDSNLKPYPYDPKKARELLTEAGYPKGFDLKLYWLITSRVPMSGEVAEAIASYLETIGIRIKLTGEEAVAGASRRTASATPDAEFVCYYGQAGRSGGADPVFLLDLYFRGDGSFSVYYNPELDKVVTEARAALNDANRAELIKKANRIIHEDVASIPIFNNVALYAMKKNVDFKPTQNHQIELMLVKDVTIK